MDNLHSILLSPYTAYVFYCIGSLAFLLGTLVALYQIGVANG